MQDCLKSYRIFYILIFSSGYTLYAVFHANNVHHAGYIFHAGSSNILCRYWLNWPENRIENIVFGLISWNHHPHTKPIQWKVVVIWPNLIIYYLLIHSLHLNRKKHRLGRMPTPLFEHCRNFLRDAFHKVEYYSN